MDGQMPQSGLFKSAVIIPLITLLLGFSLGFYATSLFPVNNTPTSSSQKEFILSSIPSKPTIDESKLPISLSLLKNPMIYQWSGVVKGKLSQKDQSGFVLVDDTGNSIPIKNTMPSGDKFKAVFFDESYKPNKVISLEDIPLEDIPLGSIMRGDFYIFKNGPNIPVGGMFFKQ